MLANDTERVGIARMAAAAKADGPGGLTIADLKDGHKAIASTLNADYKTQIDGAIDPKAADPIKRTREAEIADVQRLYTGAMTNGMPLTPEQAIAAYRTGQRGTRDVPHSSGAIHKYEGMVTKDGKFLPFAGALSIREPKPAGAPEVAPPPAEKTPAPAPTVAVMKPKTDPNDPIEMAGVELDAARAATASAREKLMFYGSRQRAVDPQGAARAEGEHRMAIGAENAARTRYERLASQNDRVAWNYATP